MDGERVVLVIGFILLCGEKGAITVPHDRLVGSQPDHITLQDHRFHFTQCGLVAVNYQKQTNTS